MRRLGGFLDLDQSVEVEDRDLRVVDSGRAADVRRLDAAQAQMVDELAGAVLGLSQTAVVNPDLPPSDDMVTELQIEAGQALRRFTVRSGAEAPPELWALVAALDEMART